MCQASLNLLGGHFYRCQTAFRLPFLSDITLEVFISVFAQGRGEEGANVKSQNLTEGKKIQFVIYNISVNDKLWLKHTPHPFLK